MIDAAPPVVTARELGRRYGRHWAVRGAAVEIARGEMVGVVGADGAGKTTLLQMLAAILDPSEGECRVLGYDTRRNAKRIAARLGYMTQGFTLYDRLSVDENLVLAARLRGVDMRGIYAERRKRLLRMAGLERSTARPAGALSGGMRKKLSLCTNLIHEPELLILDEPGLGVDPISRRQLWRMLEEFRARGITVIVATSYMDEAERCDRVMLLEAGSVLAVDTPASLRRSMEGSVFEIMSPDPIRAAAELDLKHAPRAIQVLPDRVRFQLAESPVARASLTAPAGAVGVALTLDDVFTRQEPATAEGKSAVPAPSGAARVGSGPGLAAEALTVDFGTFRAVDRVSLAVERGQVLALLGPNGAGKTTLIRALCGLIRTSEGGGSVAGLRLGGDVHALRQRVGYMSQRFSLYLDLTPQENLAFFASAYGLGAVEARDRCNWVCANTGVDCRPAKLVASLSAAERQRLALACAILHAPQVLFLDEPTSGIDPATRYRFWRLIRSLAAGGMTVVVTTHYLDEAAYCDRIAMMDAGRLVAAGSLRELRDAFANRAEASVDSIFVAALERAQSRELAA